MKRAIIILVIALIMASGCLGSQDEYEKWKEEKSKTYTPTPTPTPVLSEEEKLQVAIIDYMNKDWHDGSWNPTDKGILHEDALQLAKSGEHSLKLIGNNSDEAFEVFKLYEKNCQGGWCWDFSKDWSEYSAAVRSEKRGIGIYRTNGQFNIAIVYMHSFPAETNTTASGAIQIVRKPDEMRYVW